ncbi:MAG: RecQ family ATP-dependent DNA helicase [Candidatus Margulisbacteria bacterium]|nr:RecQ family ATP-dependent DNA helicase [Candidatus Margulisiibacteriota bacterium]
MLSKKYPSNWEEIRAKVKNRDQHACQKCGEKSLLYVHHIIPISESGSHELSNLITLCNKCHCLIHPQVQATLGQRFFRFLNRKIRRFLGHIGLIDNKFSDLYYLLSYFGYSDFKIGQKETIESLLKGKDTMLVMPTSAGKSLCFQLPALGYQTGIVLVFSPLKSLMHDQVTSLIRKNIPATYINSDLSKEEREKRLAMVAAGYFKLLYIAPERLSEEFIEQLRMIKINLIVVDEAHCVKEWLGFRPSYSKIAKVRQALGPIPILAITASANKLMQAEIRDKLVMSKPNTFIKGFNRKNIYYRVNRYRHETDKQAALVEYIIARNGKKGIIYCAWQKTVHEVRALLKSRGIESVKYVGKMGAKQNNQNYDAIYGTKTVMVATKAFGMGIDIQDIDYIVNYDLPESINCYYQESGRAGRNGAEVESVILYDQGNESKQVYLIGKSVNIADIKRVYSSAVGCSIDGLANDKEIEKCYAHDQYEREKYKIARELLCERGYVSFDQSDGTIRAIKSDKNLYNDYRDLGQAEKMRYDELAKLVEYVSTKECRRQFLLSYYGDVTILNGVTDGIGRLIVRLIDGFKHLVRALRKGFDQANLVALPVAPKCCDNCCRNICIKQALNNRRPGGRESKPSPSHLLALD